MPNFKVIIHRKKIYCTGDNQLMDRKIDHDHFYILLNFITHNLLMYIMYIVKTSLLYNQNNNLLMYIMYIVKTSLLYNQNNRCGPEYGRKLGLFRLSRGTVYYCTRTLKDYLCSKYHLRVKTLI